MTVGNKDGWVVLVEKAEPFVGDDPYEVRVRRREDTLVRRYDLRCVKGGGCYWGVFIIDDKGFFAAASDFGDYVFHWTSFGPCFRSFLAEMGRKAECSYLLGKLTKREYDGLATQKHIRETICRYRREGYFTAEQAAEEWALTNDPDNQDLADFSYWYRQTSLQDAYEYARERFPGSAVQFFHQIYRPFAAALSDELEEERVAALALGA